MCAWFHFCVTAANVCMCTRGVLAGSMQVIQEAAWVVMNGIDFRAAAECLFHGDIIRTEKLYKIAAVLTIKIKKYLCTHCYHGRLPTPPHGCAAVSFKKRSKFGKVWLWSQLPPQYLEPHFSGIERIERSIPSFHNQPLSLWPLFSLPLCQEVLSLAM